MPGFDGIGANEFIVDVTQPNTVDFISAGDTPYVWELNIWYHTLNVGFRPRISGETDWPCITDDRVGLARSYARVDGPLTYRQWIDARASWPDLCVGRKEPPDGLQRERGRTRDGRQRGTSRSRPDACTSRCGRRPISTAQPNEAIREARYDRETVLGHRARADWHRRARCRSSSSSTARSVATQHLVADGQDPHAQLRRRDRAQQLDCRPHPALVAHESHLCDRRRRARSARRAAARSGAWTRSTSAGRRRPRAFVRPSWTRHDACTRSRPRGVSTAPGGDDGLEQRAARSRAMTDAQGD